MPYATYRKVSGSSPDEIKFFNLLNPTALGWKDIYGVKALPARKTDSLTTIFEPIV
jgi:hypothetical protein